MASKTPLTGWEVVPKVVTFTDSAGNVSKAYSPLPSAMVAYHKRAAAKRATAAYVDAEVARARTAIAAGPPPVAPVLASFYAMCVANYGAAAPVAV